MFLEKIKLAIGIMVGAAVVVTAAMWFLLSSKESLTDLLIPTVAVILAITSMKFVWDRAKSIKAGLPAEDEFSKKAMHKAGYYAFLVGIWTSVAMMFLGSLLEEDFNTLLEPRHYAAAAVLIPGIVFIALALCFRDSGKVD
jgi:hypothetical protein